MHQQTLSFRSRMLQPRTYESIDARQCLPLNPAASSKKCPVCRDTPPWLKLRRKSPRYRELISTAYKWMLSPQPLGKCSYLLSRMAIKSLGFKALCIASLFRIGANLRLLQVPHVDTKMTPGLRAAGCASCRRAVRRTGAVVYRADADFRINGEFGTVSWVSSNFVLMHFLIN